MENRSPFFDTNDINSSLLWKWNVWAKYSICFSSLLLLLLLSLSGQATAMWTILNQPKMLAWNLIWWRLFCSMWQIQKSTLSLVFFLFPKYDQEHVNCCHRIEKIQKNWLKVYSPANLHGLVEFEHFMHANLLTLFLN